MIPEPYFGLSRTEYLQTLMLKWGDFKVSWNFVSDTGEQMFTKKRSILELWEEDSQRLHKVQHREAMPCEIFVEIDDSWFPTIIKRTITEELCKQYNLEYAIYKSRKGYHISVLDPLNKIGRKVLINLVNSDKQFLSKNCTWSLEWSTHWKDKTFVLECVFCTPRYSYQLLGDICTQTQQNNHTSEQIIQYAIENDII
jgi:hypothetical protein